MQIKQYIFTALLSLFALNNLFADTQPVDSVVRYNQIAIQQYVETIKNTSNQPVFKNVCQSGTTRSNFCVDDVFSDSNVQMIQGLELAKEYIFVKYNKQSVCSPQYRTSFNDDYISCTTVDNSLFFEFRFDDLFESLDNDIKTSVARAVCRIHNGRLINASKIDDTCVVTNSNICSSIDKSMKKFGYNAEYINNQYCRAIYNNVYDEKQLRTAFGIDNKRFSALQLRSMDDLEFLIKRHVERVLNNQNIKLLSFSCDKSFRTLKVNGGLLDTNLKDDILTCYANNKPIDFVFDDMNESWDVTHKGATAGLECIANNGGNFDGRRCLGLDKGQCETAGKQITGGTRWDSVLETCVLNSANDAANVDKIVSVASGVGVTLGAAAITVLSAGGVSVVVLVGVSMGVAGTVASEAISNIEENKTANFLIASTKCKSSDCAKDSLSVLLGEIRDYAGDIPANMQKALDDETSRIINLIEDEQFFAQLIEKKLVTKSKNGLVIAKNIADIVTILGDVVALYPAFMKGFSKLKNIKVLAKTESSIIAKIRKYPKLMKRLDDLANISDAGALQNSIEVFVSDG